MTEYIATIGLEVHVQLKTRSKMFCSCAVEYGAEPNTNVCPVCLGMPGALPVMNEEALKLTAKDMLANGLIDGIVPEPLGGVHRNPEAMFATLKSEILSHYRELAKLDPQERVALRMDKFSNMGVYENA